MKVGCPGGCCLDIFFHVLLSKQCRKKVRRGTGVSLPRSFRSGLGHDKNILYILQKHITKEKLEQAYNSDRDILIERKRSKFTLNLIVDNG